MRLSLYSAGLIPLLLTTLHGCVAVNDDSSHSDVSHFTLHTGSDPVSSSGIKSVRIITNDYDYPALLDDYSTDSTASVNFNDYQVVLIDLGLRPTDGYAIRFDSLEESDDSVLISYTMIIPEAGCSDGNVYTNPYIFEAVDSRKEILLEESLEKDSCSR